jgi:segregation and condensation protein B
MTEPPAPMDGPNAPRREGPPNGDAMAGGQRMSQGIGRLVTLTSGETLPAHRSGGSPGGNEASQIGDNGEGSSEVRNAIECLLLARGGPVRLEEMCKVLGVGEAELRATLAALQVEYEGRGLQIQEVAEGYQLCTRPEYGEHVQRLLRLDEMEPLTRATVEVLAIIAYRQPVTRAEVDAIRGVQSVHHLVKLQDRRLIREVGRRSGPGRPILYGTTEGFLRYFGLKDTNALPNIGDHELSTGLVRPGS